MSLPVYTPETKKIPLPRNQGDIVLRGLSLDDITQIFYENLDSVVEVVDQYRNKGYEVFSTSAIDGLMLNLSKAFPALAAQIIALGADEPTMVETVRQYPVGIQIAALLAVAELTVSDMGDLTNPSPALAALIRQASGALSERLLATSSPSSTGASVEQ